MPKRSDNRRRRRLPPPAPLEARRSANEQAVQTFFSASDPAWRWVLILGLRDYRSDMARLGRLADRESHCDGEWTKDSYLYGPLVHGLTAAAVNECAQHCEDLFAVLMFLREPIDFAQKMLSYKAGKVTAFGKGLIELDDDEIRRLFVVPDAEAVGSGLAEAPDPARCVEWYSAAAATLGTLAREVAVWYSTYEDFHVQYKHGLKLAMLPYGTPTPEAVAERRSNVSGPLLAFTNEPISEMLAAPSQQQGMIFPNLAPQVRAHLRALVDERAVLRYKQSGPSVDLDDVVAISAKVAQLLRIAAFNRLAVRADRSGGEYQFRLPGALHFQTLTLSLDASAAPSLEDFQK